MTEETTLAALRLNVGFDPIGKQNEEIFYIHVKMTMEHERERAIKRGLELDEQLRVLKAMGSNVI